MPTPEQMREAVARYVEEIHRAYLAQALTSRRPSGVGCRCWRRAR